MAIIRYDDRGYVIITDKGDDYATLIFSQLYVIITQDVNDMAKKEIALHTNLGRLTMSAANTFTTQAYGFPFVMNATGKTLVPVVHRIEFDYGIGTTDLMAGASDYFELFSQLAARELSQSEIMDEESVIASNALMLIQGTAEQAIDIQHHGNRVQDFDPPIALPFDELWLSCFSVNATNAKFTMCRVYYTLQEMTAQEILVAREQYQ